MQSMRVVHYLNQFFGQIGAEDKAGTEPLVKAGPVGPGVLFQELLGPEARIAATVICGDNYFAEHIEEATEKVLAMIADNGPDLVLAGPAFNAGRYGMACGAICAAVVDRLGIPAVTGMFPENPGVESFRKTVYIVETRGTIAGMRDAAVKMGRLALKLAKGQPMGPPEEEGYLPRGIRQNYFARETGASRAVAMLLRKLKGETFSTEYPMPVFDRVAPNPAVTDMKNAVIALVTSGGICPKGNPDHIEASSATKYGEYDISAFAALSEADSETAHGGYDPTYANKEPNRVLPVDVLRDMEKEGVFKKLYDKYYTTVGNGTPVANAKRFGTEIGQKLKKDGVSAVILTST